MSVHKSHNWQPSGRSRLHPDLNAPLPALPLSTDTHVSEPHRDPYNYHAEPTTEISQRFASIQASPTPYDSYCQDPFADEAAIPLRSQYPNTHSYQPQSQPRAIPHLGLPGGSLEDSPCRRSRIRRFFSKHTPWVTYTLTLIQITVFIYELIHNAILTGSPIEIHTSFNPMIGPSPYVLINTGGRYIPCMRAEAGVQDSQTIIYWPCPNQTDSNPTCTLSDLCGFSGVPNPTLGGSLNATSVPNQWFRFITPIFIHAGIVHIGFNMLLQILLGGDMERAIGHIRFALVYFASGIFGFVMGGNFAASGIVSTGASGSLFGIIALLLLDLLYSWSTRTRPIRDLLFLLLDIGISFALGLLPGLDNFSHIGGFLMGLVLGVCLMRSPEALRHERQKDHSDISGAVELNNSRDGVNMTTSDTRTPNSNPFDTDDDFFPGAHPHKLPGTTSSSSQPSRSHSPSPDPPNPSRRSRSRSRSRSRANPAYILFTLLRIACLAAALSCSVLLVRAFYAHHSTECSWCKYLSCLPIKDWCDSGDLTFTTNPAR